MDGDHSAKTLDQGANAATKAQDLTEGIHEGAAQGVCLQPFAYGQLIPITCFVSPPYNLMHSVSLHLC